MLQSLLEGCPNSEPSRWLHDLVAIWAGEHNYYTYWFVGGDMPRRNHTIPVTNLGQDMVEKMIKNVLRSHLEKKAILVEELETTLRDACLRIKRRPHSSRHEVYEALPFVEFFLSILQTVEMYSLELTREGRQAMARLWSAREDEVYQMGSLLTVDKLLDELDQLVDGRLLCVVNAAGDTQSGTITSEWINFYPELTPLHITLDLDVYVQRARSKEERAINQQFSSDQELGCQQVDPHAHIAVPTT
jgi:hypothetical protein